MAEFVRIGSRSDLPPRGEAKEFTIGGKVICVANIEGTLAAMDNACLHLGAPLGQGTVSQGKVVCPWHGWGWNPATGRAMEDPRLKLTVYPIRVAGDDVLVLI